MKGRNVSIKFSDGTHLGGGWSGKCDFPGDFIVKPGDECLVQPPNSKNKKHRGRVCRLLDSYTKHGTVRVLFLDTGTRGTVEIGHLIPASLEPSLSNTQEGE